MNWQRYLVYFGLVLEVFREYDFVDTGPVFWLFLQALFDDHIEIFGDALGYRFVLGREHLLLQLLNVLRVVWILLGAHFVQHYAEGPNVRGFRLVLILPKFGRQVIRCADLFHFIVFKCFLTNSFKNIASIIFICARNRILLLSIGANFLNVAEVAQFGRIVLREEDVERLDVAVNHISGVQVVHAEANVDEDFPEEVVGEGLAILLLDGVAEVAVLAVLHHDADRVALRDEAVVVPDHKVRVDLSHDCHF